MHLGYKFRRLDDLIKVLLNISHSKSNFVIRGNSQRLEYLGDAILNMALADITYESFPEKREGCLARYRSILVQGSTLTQLAYNFEIGMVFSKDRTFKNSISVTLEDALEAIIGAIYIDSNYGTVKNLIIGWYKSLNHKIESISTNFNTKGKLQEYVQCSSVIRDLKYKSCHYSNSIHLKSFISNVYIDGIFSGQGVGFSKKSSEVNAAKQALLIIKKC